MESVWWVFKQLFDKGMVYKGFKVMKKERIYSSTGFVRVQDVPVIKYKYFLLSQNLSIPSMCTISIIVLVLLLCAMRNSVKFSDTSCARASVL